MEVKSGIAPLDEVLQGLRLGDNVVWQVDNLEDYLHFARPFAEQAIADGRRCVYLRFAPHLPVLGPRPGLEIVEVDPSPGFDYFSGEVHRIIEQRGKEVFYIFDNLSALVEEWATDELLANFFQVTCPYLFELDTVTSVSYTHLDVYKRQGYLSCRAVGIAIYPGTYTRESDRFYVMLNRQ